MTIEDEADKQNLKKGQIRWIKVPFPYDGEWDRSGPYATHFKQYHSLYVNGISPCLPKEKEKGRDREIVSVFLGLHKKLPITFFTEAMQSLFPAHDHILLKFKPFSCIFVDIL